jgi:dihydroorotate dehydrogenase (NAD+) catalytic subunit
VTQLPIVGMGGVQHGRDALELIACGATHVALGTVLFGDPFAPRRVREELVDEVAHAGFGSPDDAFCVALDTVANIEN